MTRIAWLINWGRNTSGGIINLAIAGISAALYVFLASDTSVRIVTAVIALAAVGVIFTSRWIAEDISLTCIQKIPEPRSTARSQHHKEYSLNDGYIELEVYVDIPDWKHEFEIEMDVADPFKLSAWKLPDSVHFNNDENRLWSSQNIHGFTFTLTAGGDIDSLGVGNHPLTFIDYDSKTEFDSIRLKTGNKKE